MAYVFINKVEPKRIKMIDANSFDRAKVKLAERLESGDRGETVNDYKFGYLI